MNVPQKNAKAIRRESIFFRDRTSNDSSCAPNGKEIKAKPRDTPICVVVCHRGKKASFLSASRFQTIMPFLHSFYISCCYFELHSNQWHFGTCDPDTWVSNQVEMTQQHLGDGERCFKKTRHIVKLQPVQHTQTQTLNV